MGNITDIIATETNGVSFQSHKYCHDAVNMSNIEYEDNDSVIWKNYGETEQHKTAVDLKSQADARKNIPSIFTYFLDGSRHTYKVDDISYNKNVFPVLAGQIGIGCCKRANKEMKTEEGSFTRKMVITLPDIAYRDGWGSEAFFTDLLDKINEDSRIRQFNLQFDRILIYKRDQEEKHEKKGVAVIQDYMVELEKDAVAELVSCQKLNQDNYLIKDGSLEYKVVSNKLARNKNLNDSRIANNYKYVVGVSKSFDPTKCLVKSGGTNSDIIAKLKPFERTPAYMYQSKIAGNVHFVIWYLRLRDAGYTKNVFDGVIKIEKLVFNQIEQENGVDSELVDHISSHLLNERNPVCYGADLRWANHIYPIYLTESFVKSKYLSNELFLQMF